LGVLDRLDCNKELEVAQLKYMLLAVFSCCTLIAVAYLPPPERLPRRSATRRIHVDSIVVEREDNAELWEAAADYQRLSSRLLQGQRNLVLLERRDSVLASLPAALASGLGLNVVSASDVSTKALEPVRSLAIDLTGDLPFDAHTTPIALALVLDTLPRRSPGYRHTIVHALPTSESNLCLTTVVLDLSSLRELERPVVRPEQIIRANAPRLLGVCAYYGRFGTPGPHVDGWLGQRGFAPAALPMWLGWPQDSAPESVRRGRRFIAYSWSMSLERVNCAAGDAQACLSMVARDEPWPYAQYEPSPPRDLVIGGRRHWWYDWLALGRGVDRYLSDLVFAMGEDRFQQFWSSDLQLETAFLDAFGIPIGEWTMQWSRDQIGIPRRGPSAPAGVTIMSLMLGIVFVGGGMAYAARREVG
jgi:hypothetical protein